MHKKKQNPERQEDLVLSFLLQNVSANLGLDQFLSFTLELLTPAIHTTPHLPTGEVTEIQISQPQNHLAKQK